MPSTRDIRRRIKSVKNTAQITKAMQMVAASKMRRAQQAALAGRPYAELMNKVLAEVSAGAGEFSHPLIQEGSGEKRALIVISSDKGLCGGLNSNLLREAGKAPKDSTVFISAGRKASQFLARTKRDLAAEFSYKDAPEFSEARAISKMAQDMFLKGEVSGVDVLFTNFISTLVQKPEIKTFLPTLVTFVTEISVCPRIHTTVIATHLLHLACRAMAPCHRSSLVTSSQSPGILPLSTRLTHSVWC